MHECALFLSAVWEVPAPDLLRLSFLVFFRFCLELLLLLLELFLLMATLTFLIIFKLISEVVGLQVLFLVFLIFLEFLVLVFFFSLFHLSLGLWLFEAETFSSLLPGIGLFFFTGLRVLDVESGDVGRTLGF